MKRYVLSVLLAVVLLPSAATACSCLVTLPQLTCNFMSMAESVVDATVRAIEPTDIYYEHLHATRLDHVVSLEVHAVLQGPQTTQLVIVTDNHPHACGYPFELGDRYLVYAYRTVFGQLRTSTCHGTQPTSQAAHSLHYLNLPDRQQRTYLTLEWYSRGEEAWPKKVSGKVELVDRAGRVTYIGIPENGFLNTTALPEGLYTVLGWPDDSKISPTSCHEVELRAGACTGVVLHSVLYAK